MSLVIALIIVIASIIGGIGYLTSYILGSYEWYWELVNTDSFMNFSAENGIEKLAWAGVTFLFVSFIMLVIVYYLLRAFLYELPKWFINWIKDNWELAKAQAKLYEINKNE